MAAIPRPRANTAHSLLRHHEPYAAQTCARACRCASGVYGCRGKRRSRRKASACARQQSFPLLCRDTQSGYGFDNATSVYRRVELLDTSRRPTSQGLNMTAARRLRRTESSNLILHLQSRRHSLTSTTMLSSRSLACTMARPTTATPFRKSGRRWGLFPLWIVLTHMTSFYSSPMTTILLRKRVSKLAALTRTPAGSTSTRVFSFTGYQFRKSGRRTKELKMAGAVSKQRKQMLEV